MLKKILSLTITIVMIVWLGLLSLTAPTIGVGNAVKGQLTCSPLFSTDNVRLLSPEEGPDAGHNADVVEEWVETLGLEEASLRQRYRDEAKSAVAVFCAEAQTSRLAAVTLVSVLGSLAVVSSLLIPRRRQPAATP